MKSPSCFLRTASPALLAAALFAACGGDEFQAGDSADASAGSPNGGSAGAVPEAGADASTGGKAGTGTGGAAHTGGAAGAGGVVGTGGVAGQAGVGGTPQGGSAGSMQGGSAGSGADGNGGSGAGANGGSGGDPGQGGSGPSCADLAQSCSGSQPCCEKWQTCGTIGLGTVQRCCLPQNYDCATQTCCAPYRCEAGRCCSGAGVECAADGDCCEAGFVCKPFPGTFQARCCLPTGAACNTIANACCSKACVTNPDDPNAGGTCS